MLQFSSLLRLLKYLANIIATLLPHLTTAAGRVFSLHFVAILVGARPITIIFYFLINSLWLYVVVYTHQVI